MIPIEVVETIDLETLRQVWSIWNAEYPAKIMYPTVAALGDFLHTLQNPRWYLSRANEDLNGWVITFDYTGFRWLAMAIVRDKQRQGLGTALLLKAMEEGSLSAWVVEEPIYLRTDGELYSSPIPFYQKHGWVKTDSIWYEQVDVRRMDYHPPIV